MKSVNHKLLAGILLTFGWLFLAVGVIGIFLPLLPTTPFVLLSGWLFMKSSPRFHHWITHHRRFGPMIENWQRHGAIARPVKVFAVAIISTSIVSIAFFVKLLVLKFGVICVLVGAACFIISRPHS